MALANTTQSHPYLLYAISNRPPGSSGSGSGSGGSHSRDPIQVVCPFNGSNLTGAHPLRVPASSTAGRGGVFGVRCLIPVTVTNTLGFGGDDANSTVFVGHGGSGDAKGMESGKDDHAFLVSNGPSSGGATNPRWKIRVPEPLSRTHQSMAVSPDGRFIVAGSTNGTCYLWDWTSGEDNLVRVFKAHYRPVTCVAFDKDDGATLFTAGEDGVVNAWCLLDLVDQDCPSGAAIHPFHTWSEHHLSVTSLCVLPGSCGSTRLVSSSLDRNLIIMELGSSDSNSNSSLGGNSGARTLARICLPSGAHSVITDSSSGRLYAAASDGNIYSVDLTEHAIQKSLNGLGTSVAVDEHHNWAEHNNKGKKRARGDFESILSGNHLALASAATGLASDDTKYISELKGHVKAVVSLALLDPADLTSLHESGKVTPLLASGSEDGTLRIWDLHSRSCVKVLRPWSSSADVGTAAATSCPPVTSIVAVPKSSLTGNTLTMAPSRFTTGRKGNVFDIALLFKPLKRFVRGTSVVSQNDDKSTSADNCTVVLQPRRNESYVSYWEHTSADFLNHVKKARTSKAVGEDEKLIEISRLRKELQESKVLNERWQTVNNQLLAKLKDAGSS